MKRCTYCGREYPDEALTCSTDRQLLEDVTPRSGTPRGNDGLRGFVASARSWFSVDFLRQLTEPTRQSPKAWALLGFGLTMPSVAQIGLRCCGGPFDDRCWFNPVADVLFVLGFLCCLAAPFLMARTFWRGMGLAGLATFGYIGAIFASMIIEYFTFGPYQHQQTPQNVRPDSTLRATEKLGTKFRHETGIPPLFVIVS